MSDEKNESAVDPEQVTADLLKRMRLSATPSIVRRTAVSRKRNGELVRGVTTATAVAIPKPVEPVLQTRKVTLPQPTPPSLRNVILPPDSIGGGNWHVANHSPKGTGNMSSNGSRWPVAIFGIVVIISINVFNSVWFHKSETEHLVYNQSKEGAAENSKQRKAAALDRAQKNLDSCLSRYSGVRITMESVTGAGQPITMTEPVANCHASHDRELNLINQL